MTNDEIIRKYKANPTAKHIQVLADLNGVRVYEIKVILAEAGLMEMPEPKKRGRKTGQSQTTQKSETTLDHEEKKVTLKVDLQEEKLMAEPASKIPEEVTRLIDERIAECQRLIKMHYDVADQLADEIGVLKDFKKGKANEPEDGIHRPI